MHFPPQNAFKDCVLDALKISMSGLLSLPIPGDECYRVRQGRTKSVERRGPGFKHPHQLPFFVLPRCLVEQGDVAFIKHTIVEENTDGRWLTCCMDLGRAAFFLLLLQKVIAASPAQSVSLTPPAEAELKCLLPRVTPPRHFCRDTSPLPCKLSLNFSSSPLTTHSYLDIFLQHRSSPLA